MEFHPLRGEHFLQRVRHFEIEAERDAREKFEHGHLGAEPAPDRAHFQTNRAGADDEELLRHFGKTERFGAADDDFAVKFHARQFHRNAARGDDDIFRFDLLRRSLVRLNGNFAGGGDRARALKGADLVQLHQAAHAGGELLHDFVFALEHDRQVEFHLVELDAVLGRFLFREGEVIARREERFARDAADVQTGAAELLVFLDDGCAETELSGANRGDITAGAGADDNDVKFVHKSREAGG